MDANSISWMLLLLPMLAATAFMPGLKRWPVMAALFATGAALIAFVLALLLSMSALGKGEALPLPWILTGEDNDSFRILIELELDRLSRGMVIVITAIGFFTQALFLKQLKENETRIPPFGDLAFFFFAATGLVFSNSLIMMLFFWGLIGTNSNLLIPKNAVRTRLFTLVQSGTVMALCMYSAIRIFYLIPSAGPFAIAAVSICCAIALVLLLRNAMKLNHTSTS